MASRRSVSLRSTFQGVGYVSPGRRPTRLTASTRPDDHPPPYSRGRLMSENCANCDRLIGRLETPRVYKDQVVCGECHERLAEPAISSSDKPTLTRMSSRAATNQCPECGSADTVKLRTVWEQGTRGSAGITLGELGGQIGEAISAGVSQSRAAQRAAPPERVSAWGPLAVVVFGIVVGAVGMAMFGGGTQHNVPQPGDGPLKVWGCLTMAAAAVILYFGIRSYSGLSKINAREHAARMRRWEQMWSCRRCGTAFLPGSTL